VIVNSVSSTAISEHFANRLEPYVQPHLHDLIIGWGGFINIPVAMQN